MTNQIVLKYMYSVFFVLFNKTYVLYQEKPYTKKKMLTMWNDSKNNMTCTNVLNVRASLYGRLFLYSNTDDRIEHSSQLSFELTGHQEVNEDINETIRVH